MCCTHTHRFLSALDQKSGHKKHTHITTPSRLLLRDRWVLMLLLLCYNYYDCYCCYYYYYSSLCVLRLPFSFNDTHTHTQLISARYHMRYFVLFTRIRQNESIYLFEYLYSFLLKLKVFVKVFLFDLMLNFF